MANNNDLLVTRENLAIYAQISRHVNQETELNPHILAAQVVDIKPVLGNLFYSQLLKSQTSQTFALLLAGGEYTKDGKTFSFQGLRAAVSCYAYARYVQSKNAVDTPFGMVTKTAEYSTPLPTNQIQGIASSYRSQGFAHLSECLDFIQTDSTLRDLFAQSATTESKKTPGLKIFPASRH